MKIKILKISYSMQNLLFDAGHGNVRNAINDLNIHRNELFLFTSFNMYHEDGINTVTGINILHLTVDLFLELHEKNRISKTTHRIALQHLKLPL